MKNPWSWITSKGAWHRSAFAGLPAPHAAATPEQREACRLAGGLALVLSRAGPEDLQHRFPAAHRLYEILRVGLERGRIGATDSGLLKQALKEIEPVADGITVASARLLLSWRRRDARRRQGPVSTQAPTRAPDFDAAETQLLHEVFDARANALRKTVAGARTTGAGPL